MNNLKDVAQALAINVKENREKKGLSLSQLAKLAGIGKSTLSVLEAGNGNPNIETIWALATALQVPFGQLINEKDSKVMSVPKGDGVSVITQSKNMQADLLVSRPLRSGFDVFEISLSKNAEILSEAHKAGTNEVVIVTEGEITTGSIDAPIHLKAGDTAFFSASSTHLYKAHDQDAKAIVIMDYE